MKIKTLVIGLIVLLLVIGFATAGGLFYVTGHSQEEQLAITESGIELRQQVREMTRSSEKVADPIWLTGLKLTGLLAAVLIFLIVLKALATRFQLDETNKEEKP